MIDISFNFTTDTPHFWEKGGDPDKSSPTLRAYHQILWSRELPNGEVLDLQISKDPLYYLTWKDFDFGSDSIIVELCYKKNNEIIEKVRELKGKQYFIDILRRSYTIGGMIIFPKHTNSMNQMRGMNGKISDRWDLTLECIRRYYAGEESPLYKTINKDKAFFDLFVDFKGYVDFFFLQDCVSDDYSSVEIWCGDASFTESGLPRTVDDYLTFIEKEHLFLDERNKRIQKYCIEHSL